MFSHYQTLYAQYLMEKKAVENKFVTNACRLIDEKYYRFDDVSSRLDDIALAFGQNLQTNFQIELHAKNGATGISLARDKDAEHKWSVLTTPMTMCQNDEVPENYSIEEFNNQVIETEKLINAFKTRDHNYPYMFHAYK